MTKITSKYESILATELKCIIVVRQNIKSLQFCRHLHSDLSVYVLLETHDQVIVHFC